MMGQFEFPKRLNVAVMLKTWYNCHFLLMSMTKAPGA